MLLQDYGDDVVIAEFYCTNEPRQYDFMLNDTDILNFKFSHLR